jgi:hypothetical protein
MGKMSRRREKNLQQVWAKLARAIGVRELPEAVTTALLERFEADIDAAIGTGELDRYLVEFAESFYKVHLAPRASKRKHKKQSNEVSQKIVPEVGRYESLRAAVVSEYLAKMASLDPAVVGFRSGVLAGELLTSEQARNFLSSPATRYLSQNIWQTYGIPARHTASLLGEDFGRTGDGPFHWVRVRTDPPGETHAMFAPNPQNYENLTYLAGDGHLKRIDFWPGSVVGILRKLSKELTKAHPWDSDEATWFVLTGEVPIVRPILGRTNSSRVLGGNAYTTISLTVQPWVPPETVEAAYRHVQKRVIGGGSGRVGEKNLNLLRFVTERAASDGNLPEGHVLVTEWDRQWKETRPRWCYGADSRRFWRDFRSAQESVTNSERAGIHQEWWPEDMTWASG